MGARRGRQYTDDTKESRKSIGFLAFCSSVHVHGDEERESERFGLPEGSFGEVKLVQFESIDSDRTKERHKVHVLVMDALSRLFIILFVTNAAPAVLSVSRQFYSKDLG